jgi:hypothetical protein
MVIDAEVVKLTMLYLSNVGQCPLPPCMLIQAINLWHQLLLSLFNLRTNLVANLDDLSAYPSVHGIFVAQWSWK